MLQRTAALVLLLVASLGLGQEAIDIKSEHFVYNADPDGVCWFCCASMIGNHAGILPLQGLDQKVLKSGIGHKGGASEWSIRYWLNKGGVKALENTGFSKGREGVARLQGWLDRGLPVIVSYKHSTGYHAVLLTRISRTKEKWTPPRRAEIHDYVVNYVDPDDGPEGMTPRRASWSWFINAWTGRAYAFDPKAQDPRIVRKPPLRPSRLLVAKTATSVPPPRKTVDATLLERTKHVSPPIEARYEAPPYLPHQLPYEAKYPAYQEKIKIPSNQDIKDGVTRPSDHFTNNCYGYFEHDYHAEYEAHKAKKTAPRP